MLSGYYAGQTVAMALEKGDATQKALWPCNKKYMESYGKKQASHDVFRRLLLMSRDADLNYGMNCRIVTEDDVLKAVLGKELRLHITETVRRVFRGAKRMRFLNKLRITISMMRQVKAHYNTYPDTPENFEKWRKQTVNIIERAKTKLGD